MSMWIKRKHIWESTREYITKPFIGCICTLPSRDILCAEKRVGWGGGGGWYIAVITTPTPSPSPHVFPHIIYPY